MRLRLLKEPDFQKLSVLAANTYLEKKIVRKNQVNIPLVIGGFGIVLFLIFILFVK